MKATKDGSNWILEFQVEASIPGFRVIDRYKSIVNDKFCTQEFEKEFDIDIPDEDAEKLRTVGDALGYLNSKVQG